VKDENPYKEKQPLGGFWQSDWPGDVKQRAIKNIDEVCFWQGT